MSDLAWASVAGGFGGALATGLLYIGKTWFEARVTASVSAEYERKLELYRRDLDRKQKIELVSDLLAEWIRIPKGEALDREHRTRLNKLSFQATLWLPADLVVELGKTLRYEQGAKSIFDLMILARHALSEDSSLSASHITYWKPDLEKKGDPVLAAPP